MRPGRRTTRSTTRRRARAASVRRPLVPVRIRVFARATAEHAAWQSRGQSMWLQLGVAAAVVLVTAASHS
eukprot:COSAG02_NODE_31142_length_538_cov_1.412301_2_plen_69_part_01